MQEREFARLLHIGLGRAILFAQEHIRRLATRQYLVAPWFESQPLAHWHHDPYVLDW